MRERRKDGTARVLVVDTDDRGLALLLDVLRDRTPHEIDGTSSPVIALHLMTSRPYDLLLHVPGDELLQEARRLQPHLKGVAIDKPVQPDALLEQLWRDLTD